MLADRDAQRRLAGETWRVTLADTKTVAIVNRVGDSHATLLVVRRFEQLIAKLCARYPPAAASSSVVAGARLSAAELVYRWPRSQADPVGWSIAFGRTKPVALSRRTT